MKTATTRKHDMSCFSMENKENILDIIVSAFCKWLLIYCGTVSITATIHITPITSYVSAWKTKKTYLTSLSLHSVNDCWSTVVQSVSQQQFTSHPLPVRSQVQPFKIRISYGINVLCTHSWSNVCIWAHVTTGLVLYFP